MTALASSAVTSRWQVDRLDDVFYQSLSRVSTTVYDSVLSSSLEVLENAPLSSVGLPFHLLPTLRSCYLILDTDIPGQSEFLPTANVRS